MHRSTRAFALAASFAFVLTACGSADDDGDGTEPGATTAEQPTAQETAPAQLDAPAEQPTDPAGIAESYGLTPVPAGESIDFEWSYSNRPEQPQVTNVAVADYECGLTAIPEGMLNPQWDGPQYIEAPVEPGMTFCTFTIDYENVGNFPGNPPAPGGVLIGPQQHGQSTTDHDISRTIQEYQYDVNPGETWQYTHVVSVPEGETPDALLYREANAFEVPTIAFLLE